MLLCGGCANLSDQVSRRFVQVLLFLRILEICRYGTMPLCNKGLDGRQGHREHLGLFEALSCG